MIRRLRRAVHPGDAERAQQTLVTAVRAGGAVVGANVWTHHGDFVVFLRCEDLEKVGRELLRLAAEARKNP